LTKKIGVLTGGGDCPGLNAVIRAVVRTAIRDYDCEVVGIEEGFEGLMKLSTIPLTLETIRGILPKGGTLLRTTNRGNPFEYPVDGDVTNCVDRSELVVDNFKKLGLDALVVIGGEGTLKIAHQLHQRGIPVVGVPKTIDNDINHTDFTFGFMTAVEIATQAVDRLHSTAESHNRVMILEVMGRHAGWIALHSGIAGGADIILVPEIAYHPRRIIESIEERQRGGASFDIIVVAEGAKRRGGEEVWVNRESKRLGGVAYQVAEDIRQHIDLEIRVTVLGHVQRGGTPNPADRLLASMYGKKAMDLAGNGDFGMMAALSGGATTAIPIADAIGSLKTIPPDGELVSTARSLGISFGDGK
jgi:ATP-dependent phosphofructokinase / diphosphate-dependent phosphofructokinase